MIGLSWFFFHLVVSLFSVCFCPCLFLCQPPPAKSMMRGLELLYALKGMFMMLRQLDSGQSCVESCSVCFPCLQNFPFFLLFHFLTIFIQRSTKVDYLMIRLEFKWLSFLLGRCSLACFCPRVSVVIQP